MQEGCPHCAARVRHKFLIIIKSKQCKRLIVDVSHEEVDCISGGVDVVVYRITIYCLSKLMNVVTTQNY